MPFKSKEKRKEYMRDYMKKYLPEYRKRKKDQIVKALDKLREIDPDTFGAIFGLNYKELRKKKKKKSTIRPVKKKSTIRPVKKR